MTIRLVDTSFTVRELRSGVFEVGGLDGNPMAGADTREEAEQAKRAFENVLLPRFTRDDAIAIASEALDARWDEADGPFHRSFFVDGMRAALEALAAAGVFSDARHELVWVSDCGATEPYNPDDCEDAYSVGDREDCTECDSPVERACQARLTAQTMADKLDAAGIK